LTHWFSREIWSSFAESAGERAIYLKGLFLEVVGVFEPLLYLDVGAGLGFNSLAFGERAKEIIAVDLRFSADNVLRSVNRVHMIVADAHFLPFKEGVFHTVSSFSVIEHVQDQRRALEDMLRVLKPNGYLVAQVPNKFFPIELHSGLPFVFLVPFGVKGAIFKRFGYGWLGKIDIPSVRQLVKMIFDIGCKCEVCVRRVVFPSVVVWSKLRFLYKVALQTGLLRAIPLGYLMILKKHVSTRI
jgi:ubiquinone/menaquinone biosynthesis C-methylase UbiE